MRRRQQSYKRISCAVCHQIVEAESHRQMTSAGQLEARSATGKTAGTSKGATHALRAHWPEYLMEASGLATFMMSACFFTVLLQHPASAVRQAIPSPVMRRVLTGIAMGLTAIGLIYSPWGEQSGAHFNPSTTLTFFRLGKIEPWDAVFYIASQFAGGLAGIFLATVTLRGEIAHETVRYAATRPGARGTPVAFIAELVISFLMMTMVLNVSNSPRFAHFTGMFVGVLVATYISVESPLSGMSMNPARSFASAFPSGMFDTIWIYFTAPPLGMFLASEIYLRTRGVSRVFCAKLHHHNSKRCIFRCNYQAIAKSNLELTGAM
jgi:aquaporin Z